ncbi:SMI1/KNR4 family protein [Dasania marina]|uniref:SMI1/KNR4 family protein n=1 Tax=Dasania marina TaxID=471499 RepID=UPI0030D7F4B7
MDEIIEALRSANELVPLPLELPDEETLVEIEEQLFVALGADFKDFLLNVSDVVYGSLEPVTAADPNSHTYLPEVAAIAWDRGLSRELLPVCESGEGYYCIDEVGKISYWENGELSEQTWNHIWDWAQEVWLEG